MLILAAAAGAKIIDARPTRAAIVGHPRFDRDRRKIGNEIVGKINVAVHAVEHNGIACDGGTTHQRAVGRSYRIVGVAGKTVTVDEGAANGQPC